MRLYLVRHGMTEINQRGVYFGLTDHPLNEEGIRQAESLAQRLSLIQFEQVITSGLLRTQQTAAYICPLNRESHQVLAGLNEISFGQWEGRHYQELEQNDAEHYLAWCNDWQGIAPPEGESFNQFSLRVEQTFTAWLKQAEAAALQNVLLVGHQGTLRCILLSLLNMPAEAFWHFTFHHDAYSVIDIHQGHAVIRHLNTHGEAIA
ncbi:Alpha-ribazole phosphatase [Pragia fontium]|uniref:alpha-ribazole phosphatase n=1 Tax=Pragia fontium TaxID=82985 RepID=UPI000E03DFFC|nr:alpha-ribazole phosphatase [Pragia fontium]SUB82806.1 Alpha-ribazole phosphatase [Pragia fontium]